MTGLKSKVLSVFLTLFVLLSTMNVLAITVNAAAVEPENGNIYYIKNKNSGMYLQIENDSSDDGANVCQAKGTGSLGQRWIINTNSDGTVRLKSAVDMTGGVALDVPNGDGNNLVNIQVWSSNGLAPQNFKLSANGDGSYAILTQASNFERCLDVINFSTESGANVIQYDCNMTSNQLWYFEQAQWPNSSSSSGSSSSGSSSSSTSSTSVAINGDGYADQLMQFVCTNDGKFLTGADLNSAVSASGTSSSSNQWKLVKKGSDYYQIVNKSNGYVLAPSGNNASEGVNAVTTGVVNNDSQYWKISAVKYDNNSNALNYQLLNYANTSLALTLSNGNYILSSNSKSSAQCFRFNSYGCEGFGGYAKDMNGNEKASVIGGVLGDVVTVTDFSSLSSYASGSTPYTIVIKGNISKSDLSKITVGQNKTFIGSFSAQTLNNVHFRCISNSGNVIFKNLKFTHDADKNENDDIQMYISNGVNFWIDHCTFEGHDLTTDTALHETDVDKHMYVGLNADYVSVTGCLFKGHKYGLILGYPQDSGGEAYEGYPRMTIANNYFYSVTTRAPGLMRYGYFHAYNNFVYDFNLGYTPYTGCNVYSEKNYFDKGNHAGWVVDDKGVGAFTDSGSTVTTSVSDLKTGSTSWRPSSNYSYATRDASSAKSWCQKYTGAQSSAITYAID